MRSLPSAIGPYRVIRQLGEGGMGAVFEALHEVIHRRVAIKILHPEVGRSVETINRFINEARATNLVDHPGIVQITDFGNLPDGSGYLVMEYLQGDTLAGRLKQRGGKLSPSETVQIGIQIATAVAAAHKKGIVHRDLKPSNAMLVPDSAMPTGERVKILDFGLAKLSEVREAALVKTNSEAILGTPLYMSPEQCQGARQVDAKTDVYSLGCMLYEMLSGQTPFSGEGAGEIIGKHLFKDPEPLGKLEPSLPAPLTTFIERLLVKSKDERPTMREVQAALESLAAELPPPRRQDLEGAATIDAARLASLVAGSSLNPVALDKGQPRRNAAILVGATFSMLAAIGIGVAAWPTRLRSPAKPPPVVAASPAVEPAAPPAPKQETQPAASLPSVQSVLPKREDAVTIKPVAMPEPRRPPAGKKPAAPVKVTQKPLPAPRPSTINGKPIIID